MFKAIVIDEQPLIRSAVKDSLIQSGFSCVRETDSGKVGLALAVEHRPHLVVLDILLPQLSGMDLIQRLYELDRTIQVLVLTAYSGAHYYDQSPAARGSSFLMKTCSITKFENTIKLLMAGLEDPIQRFPSPRHPAEQLHGETGLLAKLTNRELSTLQLLARGMRNKEISTYLQLSAKTVSTYKTRLMVKLNTHSVLDLSDLARRNGLV